MFNLSWHQVFLATACFASLASCNASTSDAELKSLEARLAESEAEVARLKIEMATLQSRQVGIICAEGDDALLMQSGDLSAVLGVGETDVFYPQPYASPPELILPVELSHIGAKLLEQRANGYRISLTRFPAPGIRSLKWQARGVAASSCD
ncbi:hypothetical protein H6G00_14805 [Leptolyngbya sp. FACHB-541]|uniref:hypothetical protein n=1 Tax=Leptolyngbya sp. FACHB-541 TaxID=2692810 RepID=UPI00168698D3|nr:hypothetical protein [Leptolyngbya sp. FACHB-541]MBD1997879.1 hypothetical protein [Leptolyngbya sp. FACHB-541]